MLNVENVATPLTAFTLVVPASVPPPGFAPSATVINPVRSEERRVGKESASTRTAGIVWPDWVGGACVVKARGVAGGSGTAEMLKLAHWASVSSPSHPVSV